MTEIIKKIKGIKMLFDEKDLASHRRILRMMFETDKKLEEVGFKINPILKARTEEMLDRFSNFDEWMIKERLKRSVLEKEHSWIGKLQRFWRNIRR